MINVSNRHEDLVTCVHIHKKQNTTKTPAMKWNEWNKLCFEVLTWRPKKCQL